MAAAKISCCRGCWRHLCRKYGAGKAVSRALSGTAKTGPPGTYYNSQLGAWIRKSGAAGVRLHEVSLAAAQSSEWAAGSLLLPKLQSMRPASIDLGPVFSGSAAGLKAHTAHACAAPFISIGPVLALAEQHRAAIQTQAAALAPDAPPPASTLFAVLTSDTRSLENWLAFESIAAQHKMITVEFNCRRDKVDDAVKRAQVLTAAAHAAGVQVKVRLLQAFDGGPDGGVTDAFALEDMVLGIADAGADLLIIQGHGGEEEAEVRDIVERLLGLDVSGESMMERLGLRSNLECARMALDLGISHFEVEAVAPGTSRAGSEFVTVVELGEAALATGKPLGHLDFAAAKRLSPNL